MFFRSWCDLHMSLCESVYVCVCHRQNLVHEMAAQIWLRSAAYLIRNVTDTVQTVQYSDSQCTQQQYWHECRHCSWLHAGLYYIAPRPLTRFVFFLKKHNKLVNQHVELLFEVDLLDKQWTIKSDIIIIIIIIITNTQCVMKLPSFTLFKMVSKCGSLCGSEIVNDNYCLLTNIIFVYPR